LNFLQRLSGVATKTAEYVNAVAGTTTKILDTRKTTPGLRALERQAVQSGGGTNHRAGLYDGILVKENHQVFMADGISEETLRKAREEYPDLCLVVEADNVSFSRLIGFFWTTCPTRRWVEWWRYKRSWDRESGLRLRAG
jgi:nicotinate-nucleotide pyrophosphorylase (carboxylating)